MPDASTAVNLSSLYFIIHIIQSEGSTVHHITVHLTKFLDSDESSMIKPKVSSIREYLYMYECTHTPYVSMESKTNVNQL